MFTEKCIGHGVFVSFLFTFVWNIFHSDEYVTSYLEVILSMNAAMYTMLLLSILNQNLSVSIILVKHLNNKFLEAAVSGSGDVTWWEGQAYLLKQVTFFSTFHCKCIRLACEKIDFGNLELM